jgi:cytochrome d ubiquinol oxidase subunit I
MTDLLAARSQMAMSLMFHIVFAAIGIGMPLLMAIAEGLWLRRRAPVYLMLARLWAKGTAVLFAVGAVSGTVLSFELGLLWPEFMAQAGPIIGMPFSLEGFAFFLEAIFLGVYFYGWGRLSPRAHWLAGLMVLLSSVFSGIFVVTANAWMNAPAGFRMVDGRAVDVDPVAAMLNPAAFTEVLHVSISSFVAVGFAVAAIHAFMLLRQPGNLFHRKAYAIALAVGGGLAVLMPLTGDLSARYLAEHQPVKFAAMEGHWETGARAPFLIGGWPDEEAEVTRGAIAVPGLLSLLAFRDPDAIVKGLKEWPPSERPPVAVVRFSFQLMVACGMAMLAVGWLGGLLAWRRRGLPDRRWYLKLVVACGPLGFVAIQAGWFVTEVGRQPWIIHGVMRTADAVTPMPWLVVPFLALTAIYLFLGLIVIALVRRQVTEVPHVPTSAPSRS